MNYILHLKVTIQEMNRLACFVLYRKLVQNSSSSIDTLVQHWLVAAFLLNCLIKTFVFEQLRPEQSFQKIQIEPRQSEK